MWGKKGALGEDSQSDEVSLLCWKPYPGVELGHWHVERCVHRANPHIIALNQFCCNVMPLAFIQGIS